MKEVYYKVSLKDSVKCDLEKQFNIDKYNKEIKKTNIDNLILVLDDKKDLSILLVGVKFKDCGDVYYNDEYGLFFEKKDLRVVNPRLVLECYEDFPIDLCCRLFNKIKKIFLNDNIMRSKSLIFKNKSI